MKDTLRFPDDLHFNSYDMAEDMLRYAPGGFHPIIIGDRLSSASSSSSYRIIHKLGFGSSATVWLAQRKGESSRLVAVKVSAANAHYQQEVAALRKIPPGNPHVMPLLDTFDITGPNGIHSVIVSDAVIPLSSFTAVKFKSFRWLKAVARGLVSGVAHIHAAGLVHGDLYLDNVGIAVPQLATADVHHFLQSVDDYELSVVLPVDPELHTSSLPAYVTAPVSLAEYCHQDLEGEDPCALLLDFGSAHESGTIPAVFQCAVYACAPETLFALVVRGVDNPAIEAPADVWALGVIIYRLFTHGGPFCFGERNAYMLSQLTVLAEEVPELWRTWWEDQKLPPPTRADQWWASRCSMLGTRYGKDDVNKLLGFLKRVLVFNPVDRARACDLLTDGLFEG